MEYIYEMHTHTSPTSGGGEDIEGHIDTLIEKGYSGMVVTNHFYNGDNRVDRSLEWADFVEPYREDYERGKSYAKARDFDLLFGLEEHVGGGREVLIYGVTPDAILRHPEMRSGDVGTILNAIHSEGGLVFHAHPYRDRVYIPTPVPIPEVASLDGIEVYNAANKPEENQRAEELANSLGMRGVGGSDGHSHASVGRAGIISPKRIKSEGELAELLLSGDYKIYFGK